MPLFYSMKKVQLEITDIAASGSNSGAYALVLSEIDGNRKLPIVIGSHEAQAIAIEMEKMTPGRPLTHDLFKSFANSFNIIVEEVIIYNLVEGIFFAKIIAHQDGRRAEIDARTSDAVALAVRFDCPINCYEFILEQAGIKTEDIEREFIEEEEYAEEEVVSQEEDIKEVSIEELEVQLEIAIEEEDYEKASELRDEIEKRRAGN